MDSKKKALYIISPLKVGVFSRISTDEFWELQDEYEWLYSNGFVEIKRNDDLKVSEVAITAKGLAYLGM